MGAPLGHPGHHRQHRLGPVQRLDLALLIHAQHHRLLRRVVVQPDDVDDLLHEQRVGGQLERVRQVRLELELCARSARSWTWTARSARPSRPGTSAWRPCAGVSSSVATTTLLDLVQQDRRRPARPRLVHQAVQPPREPAPPLAHRRSDDPQIRRDLLVRSPSAQRQHDPRPQRQAWRSSPAAPTGQLARSARQDQLGLRPPGRHHRPARPADPRRTAAATWHRHGRPRAPRPPALDAPGSEQARIILARSARMATPPGAPVRPAHHSRLHGRRSGCTSLRLTDKLQARDTSGSLLTPERVGGMPGSSGVTAVGCVMTATPAVSGGAGPAGGVCGPV